MLYKRLSKRIKSIEEDIFLCCRKEKFLVCLGELKGNVNILHNRRSAEMVPQAVLHNICSMNEQTLPCGLEHCKNQFCRQLKNRQRTVSDKLVNNLDQRIYSYIRYRSKGTPPPPVSNCGDVLNPCRQFWELMYCGFRAVIQRDSFYSIQQTEQLYRQLVVPNTAD